MRFAVVAHRLTKTNVALALAADGGVLTPRQALSALGPGDVALARLDVREALDGVEAGLLELGRLAGWGVRVLNHPRAVLAAHDKVLTARALRLAGLPHPRTIVVGIDQPPPHVELPTVVKPRFGATGGLTVCHNERELARTLEELARAPWFREAGAVLQDVVAPPADGVRIVVAGDRALAIEAPPAARALALAAAVAIRADLVAVDLLPGRNDSWWIDDLHIAAELDELFFAASIESLLAAPAAA